MQAAPEMEPTVEAARKVFERIFVPVDYSVGSHRAVGAALALERRLGSRVCLFHAAEGEPSPDWLGGTGAPVVSGDWIAEATSRLRRFLDNVAPPDAVPNVEVRARAGGDVVRLVREEARRWGASLVIAPANVHARLLRSTAEKLVREIDIPMLIIPTSA